MKKKTIINEMLIKDLREEVKKNPVFDAMCLSFGVRERSRGEIYINSLYQKMYLDGFKFSRDDYRKCLEFMASKNIGTLKRNSKGVVVALINISICLESIGKAALQNEDRLETFRKAREYRKLKLSPEPTNVVTIPPQPAVVEKPAVLQGDKKTYPKNAITLRLRGVTVKIAPTLPPAEIARLIEKLRA